jgi:hypothetical protein
LGIGTSSPTAVTNYSALTLSGAYGGIIDLNNGSTNDLRILSQSTQSFIGTTSATPLIFRTAATERMRITSTGNVGIGASKYLTLDNASETGIELGIGGVAHGELFASGGDVYLANRSANSIIFRTNTSGAERMRIDSSGNVGIGTTTVLTNAKLDVRDINRTGNSSNQVILTTTAQATGVGGTLGLGGLYDGSNSTMFGVIRGGKENSTSGNYAGYLSFDTVANGNSITEQMRIDSAGNVGIGVTPSAWALPVSGSVIEMVNGASFASRSDLPGIYALLNVYHNGANWIYKTSAQASMYLQSAGVHHWYKAPSGTAGTAVSFSESMRIDTSGNLLVGQSTTVNPAGANITGIGLSSTGYISATRDGDFSANFNRKTSDGTIVQFNKDGTTVGSIGTQSGD